jgi:PAS domain S-box-containing protein
MSKQTRNVLIIDDSAEDRATFRRHLEQDDDFAYAFDEAELAADGIARFHAARPDCVLLDYNLPDMDGLEALAALSQGAAAPGCAVVVLTGAGAEALAARALKSGAQDYLVKDKVAPEDVRRAVTNAIEKAGFQRERAAAEADLRESEARYRAFVQASAQIEWLAAPDGGFLREQPSWEAFTGQTFDEYRGDGWMNAIHPDDRERVGKAWRRTVERKDVYEIEERVRRKDGEYRWALARAVPLLDANGAVREWVGTSTDITERKSSEEKLRVSEERLSLAMSGANIGAFDWNIQTGEINWSSEIEEAAAMSAEDFDNSFEGFVKLIHPDDRQLLQQRIAAALKDGDYECEFRMLRGDGSIRWVIGKGRVFFDDDGRPARLVGVDIDITKRKLAEDTLLENQRFTESIIETAPSILYTFDIKSQANTYLTGQAATALGYSFDELKNSKANFLASYMHPDDTQEAERHFRDITRARNGGVFEFEYRMRHKSGEWRWFRSRDMVFKRDAEGRPEEILGVAFDVTERKKAEEELRASEEFNRTVLESSPDCVKILDEAGRLQYMNANGMCLLEIDDVAPYKNEFWWNLWGEEAKPVVKESVAKALKGETARFQAFCATAKGTPKWWDIIVSLVPDTDDKPARLISVSRDITK